MSEYASLVELLRARADLTPDRRAYTFLPEGQGEETHLTYAQLDARAQAIAAELQGLAAAGDRALLIYPPGLEFVAAFFGSLYAGVTAVPAYPPHPARMAEALERAGAIAADAQVAAILSTASIRAQAEPHAAAMPGMASCPWLATDEPPSGVHAWRNPHVRPDALALLQYTSGSTGAPKGVMVSHGNILHNSGLIQAAFESTPDSQGVIWLPPYHDMGLIGGIIQPLYAGFPVTLMSPVSFMLRPLRWLDAVSRSPETISGGPNFAYDVCVRSIRPEQRARLDLSRWRVAFVGAEPVRPETLDRFAAAFGPHGFRREAFYPCYGLAESTLIVTGGRRDATPVIRDASTASNGHGPNETGPIHDLTARTLVGCGHVRPGQEIAIVDPHARTRMPPGGIGEVWVQGPSVARGYWRKPEATEVTFKAALADTGEGPFLRTGDLGLLDGDELFVVGRLKDLIIIGGKNHAAEDIERTVQDHHAMLGAGGCAAFSIDVDGEERLIIAAEGDRHRQLDGNAVARNIRHVVATRHDVRVHLVALLKPASLPKTTSGKVQRHACRRAYLTGDLQLIGEY